MDEYSTLLESLKGDNTKEVAKACIIVWHDTYDHVEAWMDFPLKDEETEPIAMNTMGYLVSANSKAVVIASTIDFEHDHLSQVCVIPRGCIVSITVL